MSHLDDLMAAHGVQFSAPPAGASEDPAGVLVAAALLNLAELSQVLELAFKEKDDKDGGSTDQGSKGSDAKKPPFGKSKGKPPFGKKNDDRDDDSDDDDEDGPPWAKKGGSGKDSDGKKPPFGKKNKVKAAALLDAATVALTGLNAAHGNWVEMTAQDNLSIALSGKKPYGNVSYADPGCQKDGKSRYPTDTPEHTRAAWSYVNQQENGDKYAPEDLAKVKSKIKLAMRKHGIKGGDDKDKES